MKILVTGSTGHLGEALVRTLTAHGDEVVALDILASAFTTHFGSITDGDLVHRVMKGVDVVMHTATLHKPHVATHSRQDFIDTNITGTHKLLEAAVRAGVRAFVFTSTTSAFGDALTPPKDAPAAWITEGVTDVPKNIYGVTKVAAEDLCQLFFRNQGLKTIVLRTSRFFPEADDSPEARQAFVDDNLKVNEYLNRRVDIEDVVSAHLAAADRASEIGFGKYIISASTPFQPEDAGELRRDPAAVLRHYVPEFEAEYARRNWRMFSDISRVYDNGRARAELGWRPRHDFKSLMARLATGGDHLSALGRQVGIKGYHAIQFADGIYPVE
jgi:UDP-glucose 4-epimerase